MKLSQTMGRSLKVLLWFGVAQAWIVIGVYFYKFAPGNWFTLSSSQEAWGQFGDFVGGTLNPMFSFLAFTGLVVTIILQAVQLDESRSRASLDELQGLMTSISIAIDGLLRTSPVLHQLKKLQDLAETNFTLFDHISGFGTAALTMSKQQQGEFFGEPYRRIMTDIGPLITTVGLELHSLAWAIEKYEKEGGGSSLLEFYRMRYLAVIVWLKALGLLKSHPKVDEVFKPDTYKGIFTPDGRPTE
jgi:hypothetical protein